MFANEEGSQGHKQADHFGVFEMSFSQNSTQNSNKYGVNHIQDLMCLGSVVLNNLFFEGISFGFDLVEYVLGVGVFGDRWKSFHSF